MERFWGFCYQMNQLLNISVLLSMKPMTDIIDSSNKKNNFVSLNEIDGKMTNWKSHMKQPFQIFREAYIAVSSERALLSIFKKKWMVRQEVF